MHLSEFDYHLPESQIAQHPPVHRDRSRLMVVPKKQNDVAHLGFFQFPDLLRPGDVLVLNDTRVIPARLRGKKTTGGAVEVLLDRPLDSESLQGGRYCQTWSCLLHASRPLREGARVGLPAGGELSGCGFTTAPKQPKVLLSLPMPVKDYLDRHGEVPLPGYIHRDANQDAQTDRSRYQCVYACHPGAVAAPTAGLHFTRALLEAIRKKGVEIVHVTLHVGPGTFLPVRSEDIEQHSMHAERYRISGPTAEIVTEARRSGRRIVAVGTTVVRTLESAWDGDRLIGGDAETRLFIRPGYRYRIVGAMLTNFHLPRSTLLMLVCAFAGMQKVLAAYREAVERGYRFFSYGDAMFLA